MSEPESQPPVILFDRLITSLLLHLARPLNDNLLLKLLMVKLILSCFRLGQQTRVMVNNWRSAHGEGRFEVEEWRGVINLEG